MEPLLRAINLSKSFGTLPVVRHVSLEIYPGEVVGLAGQSGAGKSALVMLLAGSSIPNEGDLFFANQRLQWPFNARSLGIEIIHQQPEMAENLDISSNVFLGNELGRSLLNKWLIFPNRQQMDKEVESILSELGMHYHSLREGVENLSSEQRQLIAIARVMARPAKLIIIDNPTILLSYPFQQRLLSLIQEWQKQGTAILFGSDNLDHLLAVTDRIIVLRHGNCIAQYRTDETDRDEIVSAMVGSTDRQHLTPIIWALDSYYRAREQAEKLQQRHAVLGWDLGAQEALNRQLINQMVDQIDALDSANLALQDAQRRLLTELEQERKRLAREIHDQVIQDLLGVNYRLEEIEAEAGKRLSLKDELGSIQNSIRELVDDLRHICGSLRPPTIDSLGLGSALQSFTRDWSKRTGIPIMLDLEPDLERLPETIELSIFRVVQEGLINVQRHANAHSVKIELKHTSPRTLMLSIVDDGIGLPDDFDLISLHNRGHYGLLGITERVALLGGRSKFQNQAQGGMLVQAEIPHPRLVQPKEFV